MFFKPVDLRSRKAMVEFLINHFRYNTMSSWNCSTSYANNLKIYNLGLPKDVEEKAWELLSVEEAYDHIDLLIHDWNIEHNYQWQARFNGHSGGYLVLYQGELKPSGYKSYCTNCGQLNYETIEKSNICGRCKESTRVNFIKTHTISTICPGRGTDQEEDFSDWDIESLRDRTKLVQSFDQLCDDIIAELVHICTHYNVVEEEIRVPKRIKVLQKA